jgi:hypothetical protein
MSEIEELERQRAALLGQLDAVEEKIQAAKESQAGVARGDLVCGTGPRKGVAGRVVRVQFFGPSKPWVYIRRLKKDGNEAANETALLSDWERIEPSMEGAAQ